MDFPRQIPKEQPANYPGCRVAAFEPSNYRITKDFGIKIEKQTFRKTIVFLKVLNRLYYVL